MKWTFRTAAMIAADRAMVQDDDLPGPSYGRGCEGRSSSRGRIARTPPTKASWAAPIVFGPRTPVRTWGTRPISLGPHFSLRRATADIMLSSMALLLHVKVLGPDFVSFADLRALGIEAKKFMFSYLRRTSTSCWLPCCDWLRRLCVPLLRLSVYFSVNGL
jgi:hypothetical protein